LYDCESSNGLKETYGGNIKKRVFGGTTQHYKSGGECWENKIRKLKRGEQVSHICKRRHSSGTKRMRKREWLYHKFPYPPRNLESIKFRRMEIGWGCGKRTEHPLGRGKRVAVGRRKQKTEYPGRQIALKWVNSWGVPKRWDCAASFRN